MTEAPTYTPRTYEELLMGRLGKLYDAKEEGNEYLFDEVLDEVEGLFGLAPDIHKAFVDKKTELSKDADAALIQMNQQIATIDIDDITKEVLKAQKNAIIKWEYRSDMLDIIVQILNDYQMIPYMSPLTTATMSYGELTPEDEEESEEPDDSEEPEEVVEVEKIEEPEPEPTPPPKQKIESKVGKPVYPPRDLVDHTTETRQPERKRIKFKNYQNE